MWGVWARERKGNEQKRRAEGASGMGKRKGREEGNEQKGRAECARGRDERNRREGGDGTMLGLLALSECHPLIYI